MIFFDKVSKAFGKHIVLQDTSLKIADNARCCVVGMSGAGKSVTSRLILGLDTPDTGAVYVDDYKVEPEDEEEWQTMLNQFGVVFQGAALFDSLNILENVGIKLFEARTLSKRQIIEKVVYSLERVGLSSEILKKMPADLSGGMRKRVGIARAIIHSPKYLIYDEPTSGLDPLSATRIDELITELAAEQGRTSLIITHDFQTVRDIATQVLMLHKQQYHSYENPQDFFHSQDPDIQLFLKRT